MEWLSYKAQQSGRQEHENHTKKTEQKKLGILCLNK